MAGTVASRMGLSDKGYVGEGFGVEVELERATSYLFDAAPEGWRCTEDRSLRDGGIEYVFAGPCTYKEAEKRLCGLYSLKEEYGLTTSQRTGMHVHVDVRDMSAKQVMTLYAAYVACEPWLMSLAGESRWNNVFCVPAHANPEQAARVAQLSRCATLAHTCRSLFNKYSAVNLLPMVAQGSIEFRMAPAYPEVGAAMVWLGAINHVVVRSRLTDAPSIAAAYLEGREECVRSFFPEVSLMAEPVRWALPLEDASMVPLVRPARSAPPVTW